MKSLSAVLAVALSVLLLASEPAMARSRRWNSTFGVSRRRTATVLVTATSKTTNNNKLPSKTVADESSDDSSSSGRREDEKLALRVARETSADTFMAADCGTFGFF